MTWNYHHEVHHAKPTPPPKFIPQAVKSFVRVIKDRNGLDELRTTFDAIDTNHDGKLDCEGAALQCYCSRQLYGCNADAVVPTFVGDVHNTGTWISETALQKCY
jgi:hypothetical protein